MQTALQEQPGPISVNIIVEKLYAEAPSSRPGVRKFGRMLLVDDPESAETIFKRPDIFHKHYGLVSLLGSSRINTDGAEWELRRDLTQPSYREAARSANRAEIRSVFDRELDRVDAPTPANVGKALLAGSSAVFHAALGQTVPDDGLAEAMEQLRRLVRIMQQVSLFGADRQVREEVKRGAAAFLDSVRAAAREGPLGLLWEELCRRAGGIPDFEPAGEYIMNFFAGIETSAAAVSWGIDRLGALSRLQEGLHEEIAAGEAASGALDTFINEAMRFFPPIPFLVRRATANSAVGGSEVPAGQTLLVSIVGLHHNPRAWDAPQRFRPARREFLENSYNRRAFLPFSMGSRVCGGAGLARIEVAEALKSFITRFRVERLPGPVKFDYALALRPSNQDVLRITRR